MFNRILFGIVDKVKELFRRVKFAWIVLTNNYGSSRLTLDLDYTREIIRLRKQILRNYKNGFDISVTDMPDLLMLKVHALKNNKSGVVLRSFDMPYKYMLALNVDMAKETNFEILKMSEKEREAIIALKSDLVRIYINKITTIFGKGY